MGIIVISGASGLPAWQHSVFIPLAGGEVLPVSRRAANEDVENVDFAPGCIQVRLLFTPTHTHTKKKKITQALYEKTSEETFTTIFKDVLTAGMFTRACSIHRGLCAYFAAFLAQFRSFATTQTYICFKMCKWNSFWSHLWYVYVWCMMIQREKLGLLHLHLFFFQQKKNIKYTFNSEQFNRI